MNVNYIRNSHLRSMTKSRGIHIMNKKHPTQAVVVSLMGFGTIGGMALLPSQSVQAAVKTHRMTSIPKTYRGNWYVKGSKTPFKVSAKKFGISKYRKTRDKNASTATSANTFQPYKVTGKGTHANTMYILNSWNIQTVRRTTINKKSALIVYCEQEHSSNFMILSKTKNAKFTKSYWGDNAGSFYNRKTAIANRNFYRKFNGNAKKYFGSAVTKQSLKGMNSYKNITVTYYTAMNSFRRMTK